MSRRRLLLSGFLLPCVVGLVLSRGIGEPPMAAAGGYTASIAAGITPRMSADQAAQVAVQALVNMSAVAEAASLPTTPTVIRSIDCIHPADIGSLEPRAAGTQSDRDPNAVLWIVRAQGTFVNQHVRSLTPAVATSGYFVIDDATGQSVGWGMP